MAWSKKETEDLLNAINGYRSYNTVSRDVFRGKYTPSQCTLKMTELASKPWTKAELERLGRMGDLVYGNPDRASVMFLRPIRNIVEAYKSYKDSEEKPLFRYLDPQGDETSQPLNVKSQILCVKSRPPQDPKAFLLRALEFQRAQLLNFLNRNEMVALVGPKDSGKTQLLKTVASDMGHDVKNLSWGSTEKKAFKTKVEYLCASFANKQTLVIADEEALEHLGDEVLNYSGRKPNIVASVSHPWEVKESVMRMFSQRVIIKLPSKEFRCMMIEEYVMRFNMLISDDVDTRVIGTITYGFSPKELKLLCEMAKTIAISKGSRSLSQSHLLEACDLMTPCSCLSYLENIEDWLNQKMTK